MNQLPIYISERSSTAAGARDVHETMVHGSIIREFSVTVGDHVHTPGGSVTGTLNLTILQHLPVTCKPLVT